MFYTMGNSYANAGTRVEIPDSYLSAAKKRNGGSIKAAIDSFLAENGYLTADEMSAADAYAKDIVIERSQESKSHRKPDEAKRELVEGLYNYLSSLGKLDTVEVANVERQITFKIGNDNYELILTKKRQSKK